MCLKIFLCLAYCMFLTFQTMSQIEVRIAELRSWLYQVETQLVRPLVFETCSKEIVESKLKEHEVIILSLYYVRNHFSAILLRTLCNMQLILTMQHLFLFTIPNFSHNWMTRLKYWIILQMMKIFLNNGHHFFYTYITNVYYITYINNVYYINENVIILILA